MLNDKSLRSGGAAPYFKTFIKRPVVDARQQTEAIFALSCTSRAEVDEILKKALAAGANRRGRRRLPEAFVKAWVGQPVVTKRVLYSLVYNERRKIGTARSRQRDGVLVTTPLSGEYFQFDGRHGRGTIVAYDRHSRTSAPSCPHTQDGRR